MRLVISAGILLAAAVWFVSGKLRTPVEGDRALAKVFSSGRERTVTSRGYRSGWGGFGRSELDRFRAEMRGFSEAELIQMVTAEIPDQDGSRRLYAMWERLGELKSEEGLEVLLALERLGSPTRIWIDPIFKSHGAHAFVGGWAASLNSLEEIKEDLFPQLLRLKKAGVFEHEYALGREMARFDPMEAWKVLSAPQTADTPLTGQDFALDGLVMAMAGNPELLELIPLIQLRGIDEDRDQFTSHFLSGLINSGEGSGQGEPTVSADSSVEITITESRIETIGDLSNSFVNDGAYGGNMRILTLSPFLGQPGPHLFSQALGVLMLSDPEAASRYLKEEDHHPFEVQVARPSEVWSTMARLDSNAAMALLQEPEFEEFQQQIAEALVASFPERVETVMKVLSTPEEQEWLLAAAVRAGWEQPGYRFDPSDPEMFRRVDSEVRGGAIERAIENSNLDEPQRESIKSQLESSHVVIDGFLMENSYFNTIQATGVGKE